MVRVNDQLPENDDIISSIEMDVFWVRNYFS